MLQSFYLAGFGSSYSKGPLSSGQSRVVVFNMIVVNHRDVNFVQQADEGGVKVTYFDHRFKKNIEIYIYNGYNREPSRVAFSETDDSPWATAFYVISFLRN